MNFREQLGKRGIDKLGRVPQARVLTLFVKLENVQQLVGIARLAAESRVNREPGPVAGIGAIGRKPRGELALGAGP